MTFGNDTTIEFGLPRMELRSHGKGNIVFSEGKKKRLSALLVLFRSRRGLAVYQRWTMTFPSNMWRNLSRLLTLLLLSSEFPSFSSRCLPHKMVYTLAPDSLFRNIKKWKNGGLKMESAFELCIQFFSVHCRGLDNHV